MFGDLEGDGNPGTAAFAGRKLRKLMCEYEQHRDERPGHDSRKIKLTVDMHKGVKI